MAAPKFSRGWHRGIGDATHSQTGDVLEILLPGDSTDTHARQLHITQAGCRDTDWGLAAQAHPMVVLHSTTTPTTDYLTMQHDGTTVTFNGVGATTLAYQIAGTTEYSVTSTVFDLASLNLQFQTSGEILDNNANQLITFPAAVSSAIENIEISNAAAGNNAEIRSVTSATNSGLILDTSGTGQIIFQLGGTDTLNIHDVSGVSFVACDQTVGHPLFVQTEDGGIGTCAGGNGLAGGLVNFQTGDGGAGLACNNRAAAAGGALDFVTGAGGANPSSSSGIAGAGGAFTITTGIGGAVAGTGAPGIGGAFTVTGGAGSTSSVACDTGGAGAPVSISGGVGGTAEAGACSRGGAGGTLELFAGQGAAGGSGNDKGGDAGDVIIHTGTAVETGAVGDFFIRNNTTGLGMTTATEGGGCDNVITAPAGVGRVSYMAAWQGDWSTAAGTAVLLIKTT